MNGISKIELGLENCEVITIDGKFIGNFEVENIKTNISRMGCNYIGKYQSCDSFAIEINRTADKENRPFGVGFEDYKEMVFDRIAKFNDITSITVYYDEKDKDHKDIPTGEKDYFYVPYKSENENELGSCNLYQKSYKNKFGDLFIVISKNEGIEDYFDMEQIEDEDYLHFHYSMMDIKNKL